MSTLPTFAKLGAEPPQDTSADKVASQWFAEFSRAVENEDVAGVTALLIDDVWWRDLLALTWDFRTFHGLNVVQCFLRDRLALHKISSLRLSAANPPQLLSPYPDVAWIQGIFEFETSTGDCNGIFRLVYFPTEGWKAFALFTNLEELRGFGGNTPSAHSSIPTSNLKRDFDDVNPVVLIVGAGQSGLGLAARLKMLDVPTLVIERNDRIGDNWRKRYESLRLHDPVWRDHMPFLPFPDPPAWPMFTPASKLADWLESYADRLGLDVWTSTTITDPVWDASQKQWRLTVVQADGRKRDLKPRHLVWAAGLAGGVPNRPKIDGESQFKGKIIHSTQYRTPLGYASKKVVVVGSGVSGHDICKDFVDHDADVTMVQRRSTYVMSLEHAIPAMYKALYWEGSPPTDLADLLANSIPNPVGKLMAIRTTETIAALDQPRLQGLQNAGFKLNSGIDGSGLFYLALMRAGGSYVDTGASQLIIDGKIKLKNDAGIDSFTTEGLRFTDGSIINADLVVFATGFGDPKTTIREIFGHDMSVSLKNFWDLDVEGELQGIWRDSGHPGFYVAMGNLPICRFFSKRLALQIKAMEEGMFGSRYSL